MEIIIIVVCPASDAITYIRRPPPSSVFVTVHTYFRIFPARPSPLLVLEFVVCQRVLLYFMYVFSIFEIPLREKYENILLFRSVVVNNIIISVSVNCVPEQFFFFDKQLL